jgi:hypothetical protein
MRVKVAIFQSHYSLKEFADTHHVVVVFQDSDGSYIAVFLG